ncbi:MAG: hypothetical protein M1823_005818 [Watsoniomyces obsoletus]|nr:MAG: hypothetical protein M1823_005818 [Watsoniomyces obsoletus]
MSTSTSSTLPLTVDTTATATTATTPSSAATTATPAPFPIKVGRGGAGNIFNEAEPAIRRSDDLEAQRSLEDDLAVDEADTRDRINNTNRPPPDYAHSGRGGAGNWFSPREEIEKVGKEQEMKPMEKDRVGKPSSPGPNPGPSPLTSTTTSSPAKATPTPSSPITVVRPEFKFRPGGRGGAGNIEFGRQIAEQHRREKENRMQQGIKKDVEISQQVVVDVEAGLTTPPKARLGTDRLATEQ